MVNTYFVPNCKTGYKSEKATKKSSLFKFPKDLKLRNKWIKAIPRKNWKLTANHRVCEAHFSPSDFITSTFDQKVRRKKARSSEKLTRIRLKFGVIPHIFPLLPSYLSTTCSAPRSTSASTAEARRALKQNKILEQAKQLFENEKFEDFSTFKAKIEKETLPSGFVLVFNENGAQFHHIETSNQFSLESLASAPSIFGSLLVSDTLQTKMFVSSAHIPKSAYSHLTTSDGLKTTTEFANLLSFCKSFCEKAFADPRNSCIALIVMLLEHHLTTASECSDEFLPLLKFILEQLKLCQTPKQGRRYSVQVITTAFLWQLTSTALYKKLRSMFILPSLSRLRQLSTCISVKSGQVDLSYLKVRISNLSDHEKKVVLLIDEIYTAQRVEYSNGSFIGLNKDGVPSKTVVAFMVQSISGKYKDVVCLIPINRIDTALLREWFEKMMDGIKQYLLVLAVCADNHVCNRYE